MFCIEARFYGLVRRLEKFSLFRVKIVMLKIFKNVMSSISHHKLICNIPSRLLFTLWASVKLSQKKWGLFCVSVTREFSPWGSQPASAFGNLQGCLFPSGFCLLCLGIPFVIDGCCPITLWRWRDISWLNTTAFCEHPVSHYFLYSFTMTAVINWHRFNGLEHHKLIISHYRILSHIIIISYCLQA